jgi:DNA-binding GntR family transcriptional regulator
MNRGSLKQQAYERIRDLILENRISHDRQITELELNKTLRVGRAPIREALNLLSKDGLVQLIPNKGAFLRRFSPHDLIQIYQVREVLDPLAARQAIERIDLQELERIEKKYASREIRDWTSGRQFSKELHSFIYRSSGNPFLLAVFEDLQLKNEVSWNSLWSLWKKAPQTGAVEKRKREHLAIIQALKKRDPQKTEAKSREHISKALQDLLRMIAA